LQSSTSFSPAVPDKSFPHTLVLLKQSPLQASAGDRFLLYCLCDRFSWRRALSSIDPISVWIGQTHSS
jgi:hypothetical protein